VFNSQFSTLLKDFVTIVIVWIAPWCGIFLTDWLLRKGRYDPLGLQDTTGSSPYWSTGGVVWAALGAQVLGGIAALASSSASFLPSWANPISRHTSTTSMGFLQLSDVSVFLGLGVGALAYLALGGAAVRRQEARRLRLA